MNLQNYRSDKSLRVIHQRHHHVVLGHCWHGYPPKTERITFEKMRDITLANYTTRRRYEERQKKNKRNIGVLKKGFRTKTMAFPSHRYTK